MTLTIRTHQFFSINPQNKDLTRISYKEASVFSKGMELAHHKDKDRQVPFPFNRNTGVAMHSLSLKLPFFLMSTKVNPLGETEKRFATPFGTIDVTIRRVLPGRGRSPRFQLDVHGDTENWVFCHSAMVEFKRALLEFIWGMAQEHFAGKGKASLDDVCVWIHLKGTDIRLMGPCHYGSDQGAGAGMVADRDQ
jgi:hypothetical protein